MALVIESGIMGGKAIKRVSFLTGLSKHEVFGRLCELWEESQKLGVETASVDEIGFWLGGETYDECEKLVQAFSDPMARWLIQLENGQYKISGNAKHNEKRKALKDRNSRIALNRVNNSGRGHQVVTTSSPSGDHLVTTTPPSGDHVVTLNQAVLNCTKLNQAELNQAKPPSELGKTTSTRQVELLNCIQTWQQTLRHFKIQRNVDEHEEILIAKAIAFWGAKSVELALIGKRYEEKFDGYDPGKHVSLPNVLPLNARLKTGQLDEHERDVRFEKFKNLGDQALQRKSTTKKSARVPDDWDDHGEAI